MKSRLFKAMLLGLAVGVMGLLISPFQAVRSLEENKGLGLLFKLRGENTPLLARSERTIAAISTGDRPDCDQPNGTIAMGLAL